MIYIYTTLKIEEKILTTISDNKKAVEHIKIYQEFASKLNDLFNKFSRYSVFSLEKLFFIETEMDFKKRFLKYGGGYYNHTLFFGNLTCEKTSVSKKLELGINNAFGSTRRLNKQLIEAMNSVNNGYTFLCVDPYHNLRIVNTFDESNPLSKRMIPIMVIDLFEHSYIDKNIYVNKILDYIDWNVVSSRYSNLNFSFSY